MAKGDSKDVWAGKSGGLVRLWLGPLALLALCPCAVHYARVCMEDNGGALLWPPSAAFPGRSAWRPDGASCAFLVALLALQTALLRVLPGERFCGPVSPCNVTPEYRDNGFLSIFCTLGVLGAACALYPRGAAHGAGFIHEHLGPLVSTLSGSALVASVALYAKGRLSPSGPDHGSSGSLVLDIYWGTELYPRVRGVDLKQLLICRFGMVLWLLFVLSFCAKTLTLAGGRLPLSQAVSSALLVGYLLKFFWWERYYLCAADIAVDRFGYMLCWGTAAFMPLVHSLQNLFLVTHHVEMSWPAALALLALGNAMTWLNYDADTQRHRVRAADGKCDVWGRPARVIRAEYTTIDGKRHRALLSVCGYQAIARHFHYVPDIVNLVCYAAPTGFTHLLPFSYAIYLTALLVDRTYRIDERCATKYGKFWDQYCAEVPWRLVPGLF